MSVEPASPSPRTHEDEARGGFPLPPKLTRRDCALFGAKVFAAGMAAVLLLVALHGLLSRLGAGAPLRPAIVTLLQGLVIAVPPAVLLGVVAGFELYRLAVGSREWRPVNFVVWAFVFLLLCLLALPCYLQYRQREKLIVEGEQDTGLTPILYALFLGYVVVAVARQSQVEALICGAFLAPFICDWLLVRCLARWRNAGRLAEPASHVFQYSLGTLLLLVLGLGAWMTALVVMFE